MLPLNQMKVIVRLKGMKMNKVQLRRRTEKLIQLNYEIIQEDNKSETIKRKKQKKKEMLVLKRKITGEISLNVLCAWKR